MGRFTQHHVDQLDLSLTALEAFQKAFPEAKPLEIRAHLGGMGLGGNTALQRMSTLSGSMLSNRSRTWPAMFFLRVAMVCARDEWCR